MPPTANKLELEIPISEDDLLRLLFARYGAEILGGYGITAEASVIRSFDIDPQRKCTFRVSAVTFRNVEEEIEGRIVAREKAAIEKATPLPMEESKPAPVPVPQQNVAGSGCSSGANGGCAASRPVRITRREKFSNEPTPELVPGGATLHGKP
jgi:hypothetical protein